jgi:predicted  nucleic acid-binding Zn-ribbon protein
MSETKNVKAALQEEFDRLRGARDDLRVQLTLAKAEVVQEWNKLEESWGRVQEEFKRVGEHTKEPAQQISSAAHQLIDELKSGYERIRAQLKH